MAARRPFVLIVLFVAVLFAGCGGDDTEEQTTEGAGTNEQTDAPESGEFCSQMQAILDEAPSIPSSDAGEAEATEAIDYFRRLGDELDDVEPPEEIAADFDAWVAATGDLSDRLEETDATDPAAAEAALEEAAAVAGGAEAEAVGRFVEEECGITFDVPPAGT
jgi:hypothetical protein